MNNQAKRRIKVIQRMPKLLLLTAIFTTLCFQASHSQQDKVINTVDLALLPITTAELQSSLQKNANDASAMFQLVRQADTNKKLDVAYKKLRQMKIDQPKNAIVLSSHAFAYDVISQSDRYKKINITPAEQEDRDHSLKQAHILSPKLWLLYAIDGRYLSDKPGEEEKALFLLQKAVNLAPKNSIAHWLLGDFYLVKTPLYSVHKSVEEQNKASVLKPALSKAPRSLLFIYCYLLTDKKKAVLSKNLFLSALPAGFKVSRATQQLLEAFSAKYKS